MRYPVQAVRWEWTRREILKMRHEKRVILLKRELIATRTTIMATPVDNTITLSKSLSMIQLTPSAMSSVAAVRILVTLSTVYARSFLKNLSSVTTVDEGPGYEVDGGYRSYFKDPPCASDYCNDKAWRPWESSATKRIQTTLLTIIAVCLIV